MAFGSPQSDEADRTVIEQALIEQVCTVNRAPGEPIAVHEQCLDNQLIALRTNFGRDLGRVPIADRRRIDTLCNPTGSVRDHDAYVGCLNAQLNAWYARKNGANPPAAAPAAPSTPETPPPAATPSPSAPAESSSRVIMRAAVGIAVLGACAGAVFFVRQSRRRHRKCRTCGTVVGGTSDLCQQCRHDAAEAVRRTAAERAEQARLEEEDRQRQRALEEEQREQAAREQVEAGQREREREQERARREQETRDEEARRERELRDRAAREAAAVSSTAFDPYQVLGVPRDATADAIRAAYEQAMVKYRPEEIGFLGEELQAHFEKKAKAVRQAYRMLTGSEETPTLTLQGDS